MHIVSLPLFKEASPRKNYDLKMKIHKNLINVNRFILHSIANSKHYHTGARV